MSPAQILFPMAGLVALTFAVLLLVPYARFKAARGRLVTVDDFKFGESGRVPGTVSYLAWLYVALRAAHSLVHLTYNKVFHRLSVYAASNVVLLALWIRPLSGARQMTAG
jgi:hypothetical protein